MVGGARREYAPERILNRGGEGAITTIAASRLRRPGLLYLCEEVENCCDSMQEGVIGLEEGGLMRSRTRSAGSAVDQCDTIQTVKERASETAHRI